MSELAKLLKDCQSLGIRLVVTDGGGLTIDAPEGVLTPDLIGRVKSHKAELLAMVAAKAKERYAAEAKERMKRKPDSAMANCPQQNTGSTRDKAGDAVGVSGKSVDRASKVIDKGAPELIKSDDWPAGSIEPNGIAPCSACNSIMLWQTVTGRWRCSKCDPPTQSRRLASEASRLRKHGPGWTRWTK